MKYSEMIKFLNDNDIKVMQPVIANEVNSQLEKYITDEEFEIVCHKIYEIYLGCIEEPDIWYLADEVLTEMGYKGNIDKLYEDLRMEQQEQM